MLETLLAMGSVLITWLLLAALFVGAGLLVRRLLGLKELDLGGVFVSFWLGWCGTLFLLQVWHLVWPVSPWAWVGFAVPGTIGLALNFRSLAALRSLETGVPGRWFLLVVGVVFLWLAVRALQGPGHYDSGLYHISAVRWVEAYPIVPGLANLHERLGYNNSYFLYVALLDGGLWEHRGHHVANGLLLAAVLAQIAFSVLRLFGSAGGFHLRDLLWAVFLAPFVRATMEPDVSSPAPDLAVAILGAVALALCVGLFEADRDCRGSRKDRFSMLALVVVVATGITVKLSFVALGGITAAVALLAWMVTRNGRRSFAAVAAIVGIAVLGLWGGRGVVLSGYPAFPSRVGAFPVDWRIPESAVTHHVKQIRAYARDPKSLREQKRTTDEILADAQWLGPWSKRALKSRSDLITPLALAILGSAVALYRQRKRRAGKLPWGVGWSLLVPPLLGLAFWFLTAPANRFLGATMWGLAAVGLLLAAHSLPRLPKRIAGVLLIVLVISACSSRVTSRHTRWLPEGPGGFEPIPAATTREYRTASGFVINVPAAGDQCWDAPLPCTPDPRPTLRLRYDGELRRGFRVE